MSDADASIVKSQEDDEDERLLRCLKIIFVAWLSSLVVCACLIQYYRTIYDPDYFPQIDYEEDELVMRTLKIQNENENIRQKRTINAAAYKEMGWKFTQEEAEAVFNAYYTCINERNAAIAEKTHIKAMLGLEGQTVKMTCHTCFRPDQDSSVYDIEWQQLRTQDGVMRYVEPNKRIQITKEKMLVILEVDITDFGQYFCVQSNIQEYIEIYQLDVVFKEKRIVLPENSELLPVLLLAENNLRVFTLWSEWSDCNQCNQIGKRRRVGICMVAKLHPEKPVEPIDIPIIALYPDGIPCRSTVLPKKVARIRDIYYRKSETLLGECFITCPTTPAFLTITDKSGKIVETIDAGFYSMKDKPTLPPMVKRKVIYMNTGKPVVLSCPNSSKKGTLIRWQNGSIPLNPLTIKRQSRGRVRVDSINRLHIRRLRHTDMAVYSCWDQSRLVSTIKLIVTEGVDPTVHIVITKVGMALTVICFSLTCICTVCKKKKSAN